MQRIKLDDGWKFYAEAAEEAPFRSLSCKNQEADGYAARAFNATGWQDVTLPHDWAITLPYDADANQSHGHFPITNVGMDGVSPGQEHYRVIPSKGWYRRKFDVPENWLGRRVYVEFDGIFRDSRAWINGQYIDRHGSGYTGFRYDLTDNLYYGEENVLAVCADAHETEGWWYEGAGIYRHARLIVCDALHIDNRDITVSADMRGVFTFAGQLRNDGDAERRAIVRCRLYDGENIAGEATCAVYAEAWSQEGFRFDGRLDNPKLWSPDVPNLYRLHLDVLDESGSCIDHEELNIGFRTFRFDADNGLFVNEQPVKIKGACIHQDFAGVGVALPDGLHEYKIRRLKEMGCNAYRSSHNAPAPEIVDACDRLGMLLMDETRMFGSTTDALNDTLALVRRDRTHACVLMWSIGNEEHPVQDSIVGARLAKSVMREIRALDDTRAITYGGNNGGQYEGINAVVDVRGVNYVHIHRESFVDEYHAAHPRQPMYGSEETSIVMSRGEYHTGDEAHVPAYDEYAMPWASTAEGWWKFYSERPFLAGGFMWTGFDYGGEPTPYERNTSSSFGTIDFCGYAKDTYYYYQAWWTDKDVLHLFPHWNWREGENVRVVVYSNLEEVELLLNGKSLGVQKMEDKGHLEWNVAFAAGELTAIGYRGGKEVMRESRVTAGKAAQIRLTHEQSAPNSDVELVHVELLDENGNVSPMACDELTFECKGGKLLGLGNGDPASQEAVQFADKTVKRELLGWKKRVGDSLTAWNAFQQRGNEIAVNYRVSMNMQYEENKPPFRDPHRIIPSPSGLEIHKSHFEVDFRIDDTRYTKLLFARLEGKHTVTLNGAVIGQGDAKGYPCAFDIVLNEGMNHLEVECESQFIEGGIFRGVWLTKQKPSVWTRHAYNSRAMAIVRKGENTTVTVYGEGLKPVTVKL